MFWFAFFWFCAGSFATGLVLLFALCLMTAAARRDEEESEIHAHFGPFP